MVRVASSKPIITLPQLLFTALQETEKTRNLGCMCKQGLPVAGCFCPDGWLFPP
jgi:hypothetical protein